MEIASSKTLFFYSRNNKIASMGEAYSKKEKDSMRGSQRTSKEKIIQSLRTGLVKCPDFVQTEVLGKL